MADSPERGHLGARLQGVLYAFLHATANRVFLGATIKGWLLNLPLLAALFLILLREPIALAIGLVAATLLLRLLYWKARRDGYVRFVPESAQQPADAATAVAENQKVAIKATGIFSVKDWQEYVLARPAEYWRVPMGDHAIMVRHSPGRFLYQFLRMGAVETIEAGLLWHGARPHWALAITYLSSWGPESEDPNFMFYAPSDEGNPARKQYGMFLAFEDKAARDSVWQSLLQDGELT
ncbi:MAG: hypothetical protein PVJ75_15995 [Chloroflexota bacterium]